MDSTAMADEATTTASVDAPAPAPAVEAPESHDKSEATHTDGDNTVAKLDEEAAAEHAAPEESAVDGEKAQDAAEDASAGPSADATPSSGGKDKKRKSIGGIPEHKTKKLNKKKSMLTLHLDCKPGQFYWARLKGYPPWPAVICDEEMLPESLLASRPVSTARPDGTIRDDFQEGGKNAKERTFPIMFLYTNEFQWMVNTNLTPLDPEDCKVLPQSKMTKALQNAYQVAAERHPLEYFKKILLQWQQEEEAFRAEQEAAEAEEERLAAERAAKAAAGADQDEKKPKKKAARKSKAAEEDVDMDDADAPKSAKKRKKDMDSDADAPKKKTPKVTKLNAPKTPNGDGSASKKAASKPKKKVVTAPKVETEDEAKPQLTEEEKLQQREKAVLYLRHRLQKGFLSRDQAPQESEMAGMAEFFGQLESYEDLEPQIIRTTKIHKVLKAIIKLASVPKDDVYDFKKRSSAMLEVWNKRMEADGDVPPPSAVEAPATIAKALETNGIASTPEEASKATMETETAKADGAEPEETKQEVEEKAVQNAESIEEKVESKPEGLSEPQEAPVEKAANLHSDAKDEADGDVSMQTAPETAAA